MGRAWRRSPPRSALPSERIAPSGATADDLGLCILALRLHQAPTFVVTSRFLPCSLLIARIQRGYDYLSHSPTVYDAACFGARNPGLSYFPSPHIPMFTPWFLMQRS